MAKKSQTPVIAPKSAGKPAKKTDTKAKKPAAAAAAVKAPIQVEAVDEDEQEDSEDFEDVDSDDDDEDDEYDGVTEEGMEKLMKLLGKDGLNDFDMEVLSSVAGGEEDDDEDELEYGSGDGSQIGDDDDEEEGDDELDDEDEEEDVPATLKKVRTSPSATSLRLSPRTNRLAIVCGSFQMTTAQIEEQTADDLALDEVESNYSVDEDAVPARKVIINNRVSRACLLIRGGILQRKGK